MALHAVTIDHGLRPQARLEVRCGETARGEPRHCASHPALDGTRSPRPACRKRRAPPAIACCGRPRTRRRSTLCAHRPYARRPSRNRTAAAGTMAAALRESAGWRAKWGFAILWQPPGIVHRLRVRRGMAEPPGAGIAARCGWRGRSSACPRRGSSRTLREAGVAYADDPSNRDPRFTRSRLRAMMPDLAAEGLTAERLARLARRMKRAEAALAASTEAAAQRLGFKTEHGRITMLERDWAGLPAEIALRLLGRAIGTVGDEGPAELGKLEAFSDALAAALGGEAAAVSPHAGGRHGVTAKRHDRCRTGAAAAAARRRSGAIGGPVLKLLIDFCG